MSVIDKQWNESAVKGKHRKKRRKEENIESEREKKPRCNYKHSRSALRMEGEFKKD